ncbi:MAG: class I SAM-dependent methyltransferase [Gemmatimonadota bacterium]
MSAGFDNVYSDDTRASAYAELAFPGTYYLAFRDVPQLLARHVCGGSALDFGCGAGRSTRFLKELGFDVVGVDISEAMLREAKLRDPQGTYYLLSDGRLDVLGERYCDLVLCAFSFDNIPGGSARVELFRQMRDRLSRHGRIVNLVSAPEIYVNEWVSFSTAEFPENRYAKSGDLVRITMLDVPDRRPVEDVLSSDTDYRTTYAAASLHVVDVHKPLGLPTDPFQWTSEVEISPWTIWVLGASPGARQPSNVG